MVKETLSQLKKYDVSQKVIGALADAESRAILFSIIEQPKSVQELIDELHIPTSSVYKKISDLQSLALVKVEKTVFAPRGKRLKLYRSRIKAADISIREPEPILNLAPN